MGISLFSYWKNYKKLEEGCGSIVNELLTQNNEILFQILVKPLLKDLFSQEYESVISHEK